MVVAFVFGTSFLLLLAMFRSIVIPLKAIALNLLGAGATFGAMDAAYQWGRGSALLGFPEVEGISPYMPVITFALLVRPVDGPPRLPAQPHQGGLRRDR